MADLPLIHDDIAASIERTIREEARRNESSIAHVRVAALVLLSLIEIAFALQPGGIDFVWRLPTFAYLVIASALLVAIRRGWFHPWLPVTIHFVDVGFMVARLQATFTYHSLDVLESSMELATIAALAGPLVLSGAYRLTRRALFATTVLGVGMYLWFAVQTQLWATQMLLHVVLIGAVGGMAYGLTSMVHRAVRSEVARVTLGRLLPAHVIDGAHDDPVALLTRPRAVDATVLVTDLRGFTAWAETRSPIEVLAFLNVVQGMLADAVRERGGVVDKFMGDGMLAVFGAPEPQANHAERAVAAAADIFAAVKAFNARRPATEVRVGLGIHSGELVVGCLGSGVRMEFTILGDTVNTASRLEALTKEQGVPVLISAAVRERLADTDRLKLVGEVAVRGRQEPIELFTLRDV